MNKRTAFLLLFGAIAVLMIGFWDLNIGNPDKWLFDFVQGQKFLTKSVYSLVVFGTGAALAGLGVLFAVRGDKD